MIGARKCCFILATLAGLVVLRPGSVAIGDDDKAAQKELAALEGRWEYKQFTAFGGPGSKEAEALLHGGRDTEKERSFKPYALEVKGNTFTFAGTPAGKATAKLDPTQNPKAIDLTDAKGRNWLGIYELKDDRLTINLGYEKTRPKAIKTSGAPGQANVVYQRAKK